ncbi:MAG: hypothetical protein JRD00_11220 [Deltaproteobacteria bacterium]|nr:hypothetical protein [Deltaproteobacteria bacterium]
MKKWTWQWFILLAILGMLFSCGAWIDGQPYDIDEDVYKPDTPWKQMIWKTSVEIADFRFQIVESKVSGVGCQVSGKKNKKADT